MKKISSFSLIIILTVLLAIPAFSQVQVQSQTQTQQTQTTPPANGPKIKWLDYEEAAALNAKKPKKFFVDSYTDWCGWCKKMDQTTFINPVIVDYMNKHFYAVKFNAERKDTVAYKGKDYVNPNPTGQRSSHQLAQFFLSGRMSYPSFVFLDENQDVITVVPGYRKAPEFETILNYIGSDAYKTQKWEQFSASFKGTAVE
jgi:thioredoxin-related protein